MTFPMSLRGKRPSVSSILVGTCEKTSYCLTAARFRPYEVIDGENTTQYPDGVKR